MEINPTIRVMISEFRAQVASQVHDLWNGKSISLLRKNLIENPHATRILPFLVVATIVVAIGLAALAYYKGSASAKNDQEAKEDLPKLTDQRKVVLTKLDKAEQPKIDNPLEISPPIDGETNQKDEKVARKKNQVTEETKDDAPLFEKAEKDTQKLTNHKKTIAQNSDKVPSREKPDKKEVKHELVRKEILDEYKKKIQVEGNISEEHLDVMANFLYNKMVKKLSPDDISKFPNILLISSIAGHIIAQVGIQENEQAGKGGNKNVFSGYVFELKHEKLLKITGQFAILRVHRNIDMAKFENTLADRFNSPNIVEKSKFTFDSGKEWVMVNKKIPFFFSDLILKKDLKPSFEYLINGMEGVASGLATLHEKKYVHFDIKLENMGIKKDGTGVLIDLGRALPFDRNMPGPAINAAPESDSGGQVTAQGDLYAFGITLFNVFHPQKKELYKVLAKVKNNEGEDFKFYTHNHFVTSLFKEQRNNAEQRKWEDEPDIENEIIDGFNNHLFDGWKAESDAEKELQTLIRKLLSFEPEKRGTADEVVKSLQHIKELNQKQ